MSTANCPSPCGGTSLFQISPLTFTSFFLLGAGAGLGAGVGAGAGGVGAGGVGGGVGGVGGGVGGVGGEGTLPPDCAIAEARACSREGQQKGQC